MQTEQIDHILSELHELRDKQQEWYSILQTNFGLVLKYKEYQSLHPYKSFGTSESKFENLSNEDKLSKLEEELENAIQRQNEENYILEKMIEQLKNDIPDSPDFRNPFLNSESRINHKPNKLKFSKQKRPRYKRKKSSKYDI